jgi:Rad3-related DNA helicase
MDQLQLPQIYYCSRTHSQLAQFVAEMKKTSFLKPDPLTGAVRIRSVTLGSRRNLCINSAVTRLKTEGSMSEACLDMQKASSKVTKPATASASSSGAGKNWQLIYSGSLSPHNVTFSYYRIC